MATPTYLKKRLMAACALPALGLAAPQALAGPPSLPSGGVVAAGSASILATDPGSTLVVQKSKSAIINWQNFSIGAGGSVTFQQPDASSIALNRVTGAGISAIDGNLLANGQVWLVNANGILFGSGSRIDVGGLIATTSDIRDEDFLAGRYSFGAASGNPDAAVINRGSIRAATGGSAVLSAARVANEGLIEARMGQVVLGGANSFSVDFDGDNLIRYQITAPVTQSPKDADGKTAPALVSNSGAVVADGGTVLMTARAARNVVDNVINTTGIVQANAVSVKNGEVILDAGDGGTVQVAGTVEASGRRADETGGSIQVQAEQIAVADAAKLDASGSVGGGAIHIGTMDGAQNVTVGKAVLAADATATGKGGSVAILSKGTTRVAAAISAKGVTAGGMVETSGQDLRIEDGAQVDTSSPGGASGLWLLDPVNVDIDSIASANIVNSIASTNVRVEATNDINVNAPVVYTSANSLTLQAGHSITVNADVQNSGTGGVFVVAGWDGSTYGHNGGNILIGGTGASGRVALGSKFGPTVIDAGDLTIAATNASAQLGFRGASGGDITVFLRGGLTLTGGDVASASTAQIGNGGREPNSPQSGNIAITAAGSVTLSGGSAPNSIARIGNSGVLGAGVTSTTVILATDGDIALNGGAAINASGTGDALVLASRGNFINQAGPSALSVSGSGRWLVFLNDPANNSAGGLSASPYYNRTFNFLSNSYAPVTSAGNRFVYALAPVLTVTADNKTKTYGTANPALTATMTGGLPGDAFTGSPVLQTTATTNSGAGNYAITVSAGTLASDFNYGFQFVNGTLHIDPAVLTASLTGLVRKTYDGTSAASLTGANFLLSGVVAGDNVTVSGTSGVYDTKNVGTGKTVSVSGLALTGADRANYMLASSSASAAIGIIDSAVLTASLTGTVRKTYNGTAAASLSASNYLLSGVVAGDSVAVTPAASGSYDTRNAGTGKTVNVSGLALTGSDRANYVLASSSASAAIGIIDPALLTASLTGTVRKTCDGTASANLASSNYVLSGVVAGDSVALNTPASGLYDNANAGTGKTVTVGGLAIAGADSGNYSLVSASVSGAVGVIDPKVLTVSLTGTVQKTFDGTTAATLDASNYALPGVVPGFDVTLNNPVSGLYDNANVGTGKTVTVGGLALSGSGNYVLSSSSVSGAVGIITGTAPPPPSNEALIASIQNPASATSPAAPAAAPEASDATSATGSETSASSSSSWLLDGLLRQVVRPPGTGTPRGVPPIGQVYSSWGNEAFWQ